MSANIDRRPSVELMERSVLSSNIVARSTRRELSRLEAETTVRLANVQADVLVNRAAVEADSAVQRRRIEQVDRLAREAMAGQAMLVKWADTLCQGDPVLFEELRHYVNLARVAKAQVIADSVDELARIRRRTR